MDDTTGERRSLRRLVASAKYPTRGTVSRSAILFSAALVVGQLSQLLWLVAGSRTMSSRAFSAVLTAQAVYAILQVFMDNGTAMHGGRQAAADKLTDSDRSSLVRVRLQMSLAAVVIGLAIAGSGGLRTVLATAPYLLALVLFAPLNVWERYGRGDSLPWATYMALRSAGPAAAALVFLVIGASFPTPVAGLTECAAILAVSGGFGLNMIGLIRGAVAATPGPWRTVLNIGLSAVLSQLALSFGTVLLNALAPSVAAAAFAVSIRLLTGLNALSGILITAIFPRLAAQAKRTDTELTAPDLRLVHNVQWTVYAISALAFGVTCLSSHIIVQLFLGRADIDAESTIIMSVASATATGSVLLITYMLLAHHRERDIFRSYLIATPVTLAVSTLVAFTEPARPAVMMIGVLLVGQVLTVELLASRARRQVDSMGTLLSRARIAGVAVAVLGLIASELPEARLLIGVVISSVTIVVGVVLIRRGLAYGPTDDNKVCRASMPS